MAGIGEYGSEGFSSYHAKKNPFITMQAVSASPISASPMKDFGIFSIPAAIAAIKATKVGGAIAAGAKALGSKLAATKVGGAVVKGAKAIGGVAAKVKGGKAVQTATKTMGKIKGSKAYQIGSRAKSELDKADQEGKAASSEALARGRSIRQSMPTIGSTSKATAHDTPVGESEVGETEEGSAFAYKTPFKLRSGNSPLYKHIGSSPLRGAMDKARSAESLSKSKALRQEFIHQSYGDVEPSFKAGKKSHGDFKYL